MSGCCDHGEGSPNDHHAWEEDTRLQVIEGKITGNLANDVADGVTSVAGFFLRTPKYQEGHSPNSKHGVDNIELIPLEP
jgi:hypothetical protein